MSQLPIVILTRFNIRVHFKCPPKEGTTIPETPWSDPTWMDERIRLFETYTLPSVAGQTEPHEWIVLFHKDTPEGYKQRIAGWKAKTPAMTVMYLDNEECERHLQIINQYLRDRYREAGKVITLRIDSDDVIHAGYLDRLQKAAEKVTDVPAIISFPHGFTFDEETKKIRWYTYEQNHFLAMINEAADERNCILNYAHSTIKQRGIPIIKDQEPDIVTWIEVVSRVNYINVFRTGSAEWKFPYRMKKEYPQLGLRYNPVSWALMCRRNRAETSTGNKAK